MKTIYKNIQKVVFVLPLLLLSCNNDKFFELKVAREFPIKSVSDLDKAVTGAYFALTGSAGNQSCFDAHAVFANSIGDEGVFLANAGGSGEVSTMYSRNNSVDITITNNAFIAAFGTISTANAWLEVIKSGSLNNQSGKEKIPIYEGELLFLRAYSYYLLCKMFCPAYEPGGANDLRVLPLRTEAIGGISDANAPAAPTGQIYEQIVADLNRAKSILGEEPEGAGRVNKYAASALLARVLFQMGRYTEAEVECSNVINSGKYDLSQAPLEAWTKNWQGQAKEIIWFYATGNTPTQNGLGNNSNWKVPRHYQFFNYSVPTGVSGISTAGRTLAISHSILRRVGWSNADSTPTLDAQRDKRFKQLVQYNAGNDPKFSALPKRLYWVNKFYRGPSTDKGIGAIPLIRLPEMYLTRAIIRFENGNTSGAADDLNAVRSRAWGDTTTPYVNLTASEVTRELIHNERWKELFGEGDRIHYLQGLKEPIPDGDRGTGTTPFNASNLYFPIPTREKEINTGL